MLFKGTYYDNNAAGGRNINIELGTYSLKLLITETGGIISQVIWQPEDMLPGKDYTGGYKVWRNRKFPDVHFTVSTPGFEEALRTHYPLSAFSETSAKKGISKFMIALGLAGILVVIVPLLLYFLLIPALADKAALAVPMSTEQEIGEKAYREFTQGAQQNKEAGKNATLFFNQLHFASAYPVTITVINDSIVNAFALPGGRIVVYAGILHKMNNYDELAALLSHEYSHVALKHSTRSLFRALSSYLVISLVIGDATGVAAVVVQNADQLKQLSYSREFETEADLNGLKLLGEQHIDQQGMIGLFETLQKEEKQQGNYPGFLSTHPLTSERITAVKNAIATANYSITPNPVLDSLFKEIQVSINEKAAW